MFSNEETVIKQIICLAVSRMKPGRCIVGKDVGNGEWIRPVNGRTYDNGMPEGLSGSEYRYNGEDEPALLDVIEVPLKKPYPYAHQTENWLLDRGACFKRGRTPVIVKHDDSVLRVSADCPQRGRVSWADLAELQDGPSDLWGKDEGVFDKETPGKRPKNDRVPVKSAGNYRCSLYFVFIKDMVLRVADKGNGEIQVRGEFTYRDAPYNLVVTDVDIEKDYKKREKIGKDVSIGECYVTVSLAAQPFRNYGCYKLIVAIITPERAGGRIQ